MAHWTEDLEDICDKVTEELADAKKKLDKNGGKMSAGDIDYIDKLTHTLKSIKTTLAMDEYSDDYSGAESFQHQLYSRWKPHQRKYHR